jgi:hypothetical protein
MSTSEIEIVWKEPPPKVSRSKWAELLAPLKERPGEWAMVKTGEPKRISGLRQRLAKAQSIRGQFELRSHTVSDELAELYARYQPTPSSDAVR